MAAAKSNTNWFAIGISIAVVVVLVAIGGLVVFLNNQATSPGATPSASKNFDPENGAISKGDGKDTVAVFLDFQCPACKAFEDQFGAQLEEKAASGEITLVNHPIAILDRFSQGTEYSSRSAGAAFCVAESDADLYFDYSKVLFENQPTENTPGLTTDQLADYASQVGVDDDVVKCITDETYRKFGVAQAKKHDIQGTPTVEINGERLDLQNQADMKKLTDLLG
ncbi:DsbA family protein [Microbacterium paraoxydans]|uniref:Thioredoxin domain-containing protein n=1 Tax=Microbacterium paraoxydans TaxID=199592 RepID=A0ABS5IPG7_9MICO|nr:thioredoxin domain-containing protein [Microbacterium paraoxydans]MBS0024272.1 thioredoxin domain-containing protein [Microbacterium paraoxydans]